MAEDSRDDADETLPFPETVLDERWEGGPPVAAIRKAQAREEEDRGAVQGPSSEHVEAAAPEARADGAKRRLIEQIAAFVESRTSDPAEGERLARDIFSSFTDPTAPDAGDRDAE